jgi:hypothetical protein
VRRRRGRAAPPAGRTGRSVIDPTACPRCARQPHARFSQTGSGRRAGAAHLPSTNSGPTLCQRLDIPVLQAARELGVSRQLLHGILAEKLPVSAEMAVRLAIYLDLADAFWRCVEIGANGWRIADDPPVRFRRSPAMQPLPLPVRGGSIDSLAPFLNLASENDIVPVVAWLLGALRADGPYPVLAIAGEQGSAKTVCSKLLRALIDPSVAPVRALPRDEAR